MKLKEGKMFLFIILLIIILGYTGLIIYRIINNSVDALDFLMIVLMISSLENCLEKK